MLAYRIFVLAITLIATITLNAQEHLIDRTTAIRNNRSVFYSVDGHTMSMTYSKHPFTIAGLKKVYADFKISDLTRTSDPQLPVDNYLFHGEKEVAAGLNQYLSTYFLKNKFNRVTVMHITGYEHRSDPYERELVELAFLEQLPETSYQTTPLNNVQFAGRELELGATCNWMNTNNIGCPMFGQLDWSYHESLEGARKHSLRRYKMLEVKNRGKVVTDGRIPVIFEGESTTARKVTYDFAGVDSPLTKESNGDLLTVYYVSATVRGKHVSCTLSSWNKDAKDETGVAPLISEVMQLPSR
ncbi:MAG: hypothetical protein WBA16_09380 [Nonlabens sp.]